MKKVLKSIVNILAWVVLILALLVTILVFSSARNNGVANLFGYIPLTVESDSMYPTFSQGDLIICREIDSIDALQENDVITLEYRDKAARRKAEFTKENIAFIRLAVKI